MAAALAAFAHKILILCSIFYFSDCCLVSHVAQRLACMNRINGFWRLECQMIFFFRNVSKKDSSFIVIFWRKHDNKQQTQCSYIRQNKWGPHSPLIRSPSYFWEAISSFLFPFSSFIRFVLMWKFLCGQFAPDNISPSWRLIIPLLLRQTLINITCCRTIIRGKLVGRIWHFTATCVFFVVLLFWCELFLCIFYFSNEMNAVHLEFDTTVCH